ncbi:MAG: alpha/beta hydrolase [Gammaproteobacteria bacterium]|nr:alpha/beta hydrolase [Gammaproteobacteria bacterium]
MAKEPYIDPQISLLLEQQLSDGQSDYDWDQLSEEEIINMRALAAEACKENPQIGPDLPLIMDLQALGAFGKTPVRLYKPVSDDKPLPALIFLHGGGWCSGDIESRDDRCRLLAAESGMIIFSVGYVLAPEYKFPKPLEDVTAVCRWIREQGDEFGIDPDRLGIGGDSAGANLALAAALDFRNDGENFFKYLALYYGVYSHDHSTDSHHNFGSDERYTLSSKAMDCCWRTYLNDPCEDQNLRSAPLLADLSDLPPAYMICGSLDPLLDDSRHLYKKMINSGNDAELRIYDGATHGFLAYFNKVDLSKKAMIEAAADLRLRMFE